MSKTYNSDLQTNNARIQALINKANELPEAGGVELPKLTNEASVTEVFEGKEVIDSEGNKKTGTFTIDTEMNTQRDLIAQITTALEGKATGGGITLPELTMPANSGQILNGYEAIDGLGNKITGNIPNAEVDYTECPINESEGILYPLVAFNKGGYVPDGYAYGFDYQLPTKAATTITPTTEEQVAVSAGTYCTGDIKVAAASGGGSASVETCTITVTSGVIFTTPTIYYTNENILIQNVSTLNATLNTVKNSIIVITNLDMSPEYNNCELIFYTMGTAAFMITQDCTIRIRG